MSCGRCVNASRTVECEDWRTPPYSFSRSSAIEAARVVHSALGSRTDVSGAPVWVVRDVPGRSAPPGNLPTVTALEKAGKRGSQFRHRRLADSRRATVPPRARHCRLPASGRWVRCVKCPSRAPGHELGTLRPLGAPATAGETRAATLTLHYVAGVAPGAGRDREARAPGRARSTLWPRRVRGGAVRGSVWTCTAGAAKEREIEEIVADCGQKSRERRSMEAATQRRVGAG